MIIPVTLSGGSGTRLWPLSRPARPKQLLRLTGEQTMLQLTVDRVGNSSRFASPIIVANLQHADEIERQLAETGSQATLVLEPAARNTAPAIALAALNVAAEDLILVMPSDHLIRDPDAFLKAIEAACAVADEGWLVTFGVAPDRPESGYGYIRKGQLVAPGVYQAERFLEKPDAQTAEKLAADGMHSWNAGIFLFRADTFLSGLELHEPDVLAAARAAHASRNEDGARVLPEANSFAASPSISVDYALMERADRVAVVPVSMGWSDIGSWDALHEIDEAKAKGVSIGGKALAIDSSNCLLRSEGPTIVAVGVEDLIVVATEDMVLIVPRGQSQRVREAVDAVKARG